MDDDLRESAARARSRIERGEHDAPTFRAALLAAPPAERDAWLDLVLGVGELPDDGPELPRDGVPYLPCPVDPLLRLVERVPVRASDVFVDVGAGVGRAAALVHLITGCEAIGLEVQPGLVRAARDLAARIRAARVSFLEGDAVDLVGRASAGSIFFLYCPFSGDRLARVLASLEPMARTRPIRVCTVDLPLPPCAWLALEPPPSPDLAIHRSTVHPRELRRSR